MAHVASAVAWSGRNAEARSARMLAHPVELSPAAIDSKLHRPQTRRLLLRTGQPFAACTQRARLSGRALDGPRPVDSRTRCAAAGMVAYGASRLRERCRLSRRYRFWQSWSTMATRRRGRSGSLATMRFPSSAILCASRPAGSSTQGPFPPVVPAWQAPPGM